MATVTPALDSKLQATPPADLQQLVKRLLESGDVSDQKVERFLDEIGNQRDATRGELQAVSAIDEPSEGEPQTERRNFVINNWVGTVEGKIDSNWGEEKLRVKEIEFQGFVSKSQLEEIVRELGTHSRLYSALRKKGILDNSHSSEKSYMLDLEATYDEKDTRAPLLNLAKDGAEFNEFRDENLLQSGSGRVKYIVTVDRSKDQPVITIRTCEVVPYYGDLRSRVEAQEEECVVLDVKFAACQEIVKELKDRVSTTSWRELKSTYFRRVKEKAQEALTAIEAIENAADIEVPAEDLDKFRNGNRKAKFMPGFITPPDIDSTASNSDLDKTYYGQFQTIVTLLEEYQEKVDYDIRHRVAKIDALKGSVKKLVELIESDAKTATVKEYKFWEVTKSNT